MKHLFSKYLLSVYYVPGLILRYKNIAESKTDKVSAIMELVGRDVSEGNKHKYTTYHVVVSAMEKIKQREND